MTWKDTTSYGRGAKERKPTTWALEVGELNITVTCAHIHCPGQWVVHCFKVGIDTVPLAAVDEQGAKRLAIELVRARVAKWHFDLQKLTA